MTKKKPLFRPTLAEVEAAASVALDGDTQSCEACYRADHPRGHTCSLAPMSEEERVVVEAAMNPDDDGDALRDACRALREARKTT